MAGTWTPNNYLWVPPAGPDYDSNFTEGCNRVDAALHLLAQVQSFYRLRVANNATTPATKIDITADSVAVFDSSNNPLVLRNFSKTVDCTTTGANALDTGTLAGGWYYFYAIAKTDGTMAGLASTSATTPTMPSGYIYKKLVSAIYNAGGIGTPFRTIHQLDSWVYDTGVGSGALFMSTDNTWTLKNLSAIIPFISTYIQMQVISPSATYSIDCAIAWNSYGTLTYVYQHCSVGEVVGDSYSATSPFIYPLNSSAPQTIYVKGADTNLRGIGVLIGYKLDI